MDDGFQCRFDGCIHSVKDRPTARKHVLLDHGADLDMYLLKVKVQKVCNSNLHKYCMVEVEDTGFDETTEAGQMLAAFRQQAKELLPNCIKGAVHATRGPARKICVRCPWIT